MSDSFVHLHLHTEYSMLDGASRISDVVAAAVADGQPAVGITDHGNMYGVLDLSKAARAEGLNPVIGMEAYLENGSRFDRPRRGDLETFHLTLLAESNVGYRNLMKLSSRAFLEGYYYKPRTDWELLEAYHEGLVATTGCLGGLVCQLILAGEDQSALQAAARFQDIFGRDQFFVELQDHGQPEDAQVLTSLLEIARAIKAPLLATNDSHYTSPEDAEAHDALLCVQTGKLIADEDRLRFNGEGYWIKTAAEMRHLFRDHPEACDNTLWVAERSHVDIEFGQSVLPTFPVPQGYDEDSYLRQLASEGAQRRYGDPIPPHVIERLDYELDVIKSMGFSAYFLVVWDLVQFARRSAIRVGPGRGSAAGSCVAYSLGIVDIDPIKYDLLFERFLNPGRKEMPDIDMDFDSRGRGEMIRYAADKYGHDRVAQIITFSTIKARAAVRDGARVLGYPWAVGDKVAKAMPPLIMGRDTPLRACFEKEDRFGEGYKMAADLRQLYESDVDVRRVVDVARGLEGMRRQDGIHAAAVVITREPLTDYLPIQRKPEPGTPLEESPIVTQYEMHGVEELGLLKMDFLGLRNLDVMEIALDLIEESTGERPDVDRLPLDDPGTFEMLQRGDSIGVFQLEGGPMRALMRSLAPTTFEDVAALVALYRPGPMAANMHSDYADRKNGRQPVTYYHEDLQEILAPTFGLMIYQEQLMRVAQRLAGYSLEEADNLRKATGKKIRELIATHRKRFVDGCDANGYGREFGERMFDIIEPFADYSFNKSHSVGYGLVAYQTAWLKANFPAPYLAALLTSVKANQDRAAVYLNECRQLGIDVRVPDVNVSKSAFSVLEGTGGLDSLSFGLSSVRNVGEGVAELILAGRADGPYLDFHDFSERVDVTALNKRTVESLIKAGGFDSLDHPRKGLLMVFEQIVDTVTQRRREREQGTLSFFDLEGSGAQGSGFDERIEIPDIEFDKAERLRLEKEMLGLYISDHPLIGAERALARFSECSISELRESDEGAMRTVAGVVTSLDRKWTRRGDAMATLVLEDLGAAVEVMVFPRTMTDYGELLADDAIVCVKGRLDRREDTPKLIATDIVRPDLVLDSGPPVRLRTKTVAMTADRVGELRRALERHRGDSPVFIHLDGHEKETVLRLGDDFLVDASNGLHAELRVIFGADCIV